MDSLRLKVDNIEAKGEIARFEQFLLLSLCFHKSVCCRGVYMRVSVNITVSNNMIVICLTLSPSTNLQKMTSSKISAN